MISASTAVKYVSLSSAVFYILAVLFGAPFFSDIIGTATLAASLTVVSIIPAVLLFESEERLLEVFLLSFSCDINPTFKETVPLYTSAFAAFGAWAAASVHPLDWDRWWQRYPLPSVCGCFIGAIVGLLTCILRNYFKKNNSSVKAKNR